MKHEDISVEDYVRKYALLVPEQSLKFGLLIALGDSPESVKRILSMNEGQYITAIHIHQKLGFIDGLSGHGTG